jgi:hypothetical protein
MHFKQFLAFAAPRYYPQGGWHDFIGSFDSKAEAVAAVTEWLMDNARSEGEGGGNVVDLESGETHHYSRVDYRNDGNVAEIEIEPL